MSPNSKADRAGWSRDVRSNNGTASGVTYSRRSYYYDREFSDSIYRPTDDDHVDGSFKSHDSLVRRGRARPLFEQAGVVGAPEKKKYGDDDPDLPTPGCVYESATPVLPAVCAEEGNEGNAYELPERAPAQLRSPAADSSLSQPGPSLTFAGIDLTDIAQDIFERNLPERLINMYMGVRNSHGVAAETAFSNFLGVTVDDVAVDPYHLEAGPRPQLRALYQNQSASSENSTLTTLLGVLATGLATWNMRHKPETETETVSGTGSGTQERVCYYLIGLVALGVVVSFALALWWARTQGDVSAAFTLGGYVIAVDALIAGFVGMCHMPRCRCWKGSA
jgi:hypothetical protein